MEISKAEIKLINALNTSHGRKKNQAFIVEGVKMVEELLASHFEIILLLSTDDWADKHPEFSKQSYFRLIKDRDLQKLSNFSTSNQVLALANIPKSTELIINEDELILVLDTIQDPGNMGTIIRTADWFGINKIICSHETTDVFSHKVVQASMGSVFRSQIYYTDLLSLLLPYSESHHIYGSLLDGDNIFKSTLAKSGFIIVGNESKGISPSLKGLINKALYIPQHKDSMAESLNASVACGIILSEFMK